MLCIPFCPSRGFESEKGSVGKLEEEGTRKPACLLQFACLEERKTKTSLLPRA